MLRGSVGGRMDGWINRDGERENMRKYSERDKHQSLTRHRCRAGEVGSVEQTSGFLTVKGKYRHINSSACTDKSSEMEVLHSRA